MIVAYADPPYPGNAELYADHPDYAGEVDHEALVGELETFDGWALSTSSRSLRDVLPLCPPETRVLVWLNHNVGRAWEPVLVSPARPIPAQGGGPLDWIRVESEGFQWRARPEGYVIGRKPAAFCRWLFHWLGCEPGAGDELVDLFPGSGAVGQAWLEWNLQPALGARVVGRRDVRRWHRDRPGWLELELEDDAP